MGELYGPFEAGAGASFGEDGWQRVARLWAPSGVEFGVDDGLLVSANGGMNSAIRYGNAFVDGFHYRNEVAWKGFTHASSTGTAGQSRNDLVILRLDRTANTVTAMVLTGTFAVTPVDPAITTTDTVWDLPMARVNVVANAAAIGTITDLRKFIYPPKVMAYASNKGTATTSLANNAWSALANFSSTPFIKNLRSASGTNLVCGVAGVYEAYGMCTFAGNATGRRGVAVGVNGVVDTDSQYLAGPFASGASTICLGSVPQFYTMAEGDTLGLYGFQESGAALNFGITRLAMKLIDR